MKIGFVCDIHMPDNDISPQKEFLEKAAMQMKQDDIAVVINLGDTTAAGEYGGLMKYLDILKGFKHHILLGNSDVRDKNTAYKFVEKSEFLQFSTEDFTIWGVNTPYGEIEDSDKKLLDVVKDGDVLLMHHSLPGLTKESRSFVEKLTDEKEITIIHAHSHRWIDYKMGKSRVVGLRALDPDKSIGNFPCVTYFDTELRTFEEKIFPVSNKYIQSTREMFGISCVDNHTDVDYALDNSIYAIELRCNGSDWEPDYTLVPKLEQWRKKTNGYLSVHMPNLRYKNGSITGKEQWAIAVEYVKNIGANAMTMHPPRAKVSDMEKTWEEFLKLYVSAVNSVNDRVKVGIENIHMGETETETDRGFGYIPEEVCSWIDAINEAVGSKARVGHTLDVGHARNNGVFAEKYPISRWYEIMGKRTVAYHIHQVVPRGDTYDNHTAIENWFGPMISYSSFFHCMEKGIINRVPIFFEVKGCENYSKSIAGFEACFK